MRGQIIQDDSDLLCPRIVLIRQVAHTGGKILPGALIRHLHMPPRPMGIDHHKQIRRAVTPVLAIVTLGLPRQRGDRIPDLADRLHRAFVKAHHRVVRRRPLGV